MSPAAAGLLLICRPFEGCAWPARYRGPQRCRLQDRHRCQGRRHLRRWLRLMEEDGDGRRLARRNTRRRRRQGRARGPRGRVRRRGLRRCRCGDGRAPEPGTGARHVGVFKKADAATGNPGRAPRGRTRAAHRPSAQPAERGERAPLRPAAARGLSAFPCARGHRAGRRRRDFGARCGQLAPGRGRAVPRPGGISGPRHRRHGRGQRAAGRTQPAAGRQSRDRRAARRIQRVGEQHPARGAGDRALAGGDLAAAKGALRSRRAHRRRPGGQPPKAIWR